MKTILASNKEMKVNLRENLIRAKIHASYQRDFKIRIVHLQSVLNKKLELNKVILRNRLLLEGLMKVDAG
jgi:hypothetical protein